MKTPYHWPFGTLSHTWFSAPIVAEWMERATYGNAARLEDDPMLADMFLAAWRTSSTRPPDDMV
jgi:hypothetical protein